MFNCCCAKSSKGPKIKSHVAQPLASSKIPKSSIQFQANSFQSTPFTLQSTFKQTEKPDKFQNDRQPRDQNYSCQVNLAKQSKLIVSKDILTYDLDNKDGVSKIPIINTFHYGSELNHCFIDLKIDKGKDEKVGSKMLQQNVQDSRMRASDYQGQSDPKGLHRYRGSNKSDIEYARYTPPS